MAAHAASEGRTGLASLLLEHERVAAEQVPLLLELGGWGCMGSVFQFVSWLSCCWQHRLCCVVRAGIPTASHMPTAARAMGLVSAPSAGEDERALDKAVESGDSGEQRLLCF